MRYTKAKVKVKRYTRYSILVLCVYRHVDKIAHQVFEELGRKKEGPNYQAGRRRRSHETSR